MRTGTEGKNNRYFHNQWQLGSFCFLKFPTPQPVKLVGVRLTFGFQNAKADWEAQPTLLQNRPLVTWAK
jgi:hypothetical protein